MCVCKRVRDRKKLRESEREGECGIEKDGEFERAGESIFLLHFKVYVTKIESMILPVIFIKKSHIKIIAGKWKVTSTVQYNRE